MKWQRKTLKHFYEYTQYIQGFKGKHKHRINIRYKKISDFNVMIKTTQNEAQGEKTDGSKQ